VTGAGRGLGRAYAHLFAERGARVVVHDAGVGLDGSGGDPTVARRVVDEIRARGHEATPAFQNLDTRAMCRQLVQEALDTTGRLDAVVLNAGIAAYERLKDVSQEVWERVLRVHLAAPLWISQAVFPAMKEHGYGRLVLTVSGHGLVRSADPLAAYAVAKAGTFGLMKVLADEGAPHGIHANAISPVAVTRMSRRSPAPGELLPEHVAPAVVFLASDACSMSGLVVGAAGGRFTVGDYEISKRVDLGGQPATPEAVAAGLQLLDGS
jgi:NAD(P)-dependent dehydrogenase (short-subunit alcohol dehydrogenase family)